MVPITARPAEVEDRKVAGHWEGDLVMGRRPSAVATSVERTSRFLVLVALPDGLTSEQVRPYLVGALLEVPALVRKSLTWDRGRKMATHRHLTVEAGCPVYFCAPRNPWQRGTNENTNRLLRQYLGKSADLSAPSQSDLTDHGRADAYLAGSGLAFTVLRPSAFMGGVLVLASAIRRGLLPGTSGHGATTWIDSGDIAAAAHRVLTDPDRQGGSGADGRNYLLTGTQPLSLPQVAVILTQQLGRKVRYVHIPGPVLYAVFRTRLPRREARGAVAQLAVVVRRGLDDVRVYSTDLTDLIGRPALDMTTYVRQHRAELQ